MEAAVTVRYVVLLALVTASRARSASDYFQLAGFQNTPTRPEDALVIFTSRTPPLVCELGEKGIGGGRVAGKLAFILEGPHGGYTCIFQSNETALTRVQQFFDKIPYNRQIFTYRTTNLWYLTSRISCTVDSQIPDEFFHFIVQRPHEDRPLKCCYIDADWWLSLRFPGYPTIACQLESTSVTYTFNLPGIVGPPFSCYFRLYSDLPLGDTDTEQRLHRSLLQSLPARGPDGRRRVSCSPSGSSSEPTHFQLQLPGSKIYNCGFFNV